MTPNKPKPYTPDKQPAPPKPGTIGGRGEIELTQVSFSLLAHAFFFAGLFVMWVATRPAQ